MTRPKVAGIGRIQRRLVGRANERNGRFTVFSFPERRAAKAMLRRGIVELVPGWPDTYVIRGWHA